METQTRRQQRKTTETAAEREARLQHRRERRAERKAEERRLEHRRSQIIVEYHRLQMAGEQPQPTRVYVDVPRIPPHILSELVETAERCGVQWSCPVCMEDHNPRAMKISPCGHKLCGGCRESLHHPECPECRSHLG